jgi:pectate lyase
MGWGVVQRHGLEGTTGGGGGEIVNVSSAGDLASAVSGDAPRIVLFSGSISSSRIDIGSNKTVIGVGANATLDGQLNCDTSRNVIIRNFNIHGGNDGIQVTDDSYHIWIDHCSLWDCSDGLLDLKGRSDCYLITWTHFFDHNKCNLLNSGSRNYDDRGFINGTLHHNFYDGTVQRNPRAGFGMIHIFNDYNFENSSYGIGFHTESLVFAEKNYFHNMDNSINQMYNESGYDPEELGDCLAEDNYFDNASGDESTGIGFDPNEYYLYDFFLDEAQAVKDIVLAGAGTGAEYGDIGLLPIPGQGCVGVESSILKWKTGTVTPTSYNVYFGTTTTPPEVLQTSDTSYNAGSLSSGTQYYWAVDQVTSSGTVPGKLWTFVAR